MNDARAWAARLARGEPIAERVAVVVAHPDDETLWTGSLLGRLRDGLLIHLTDGAPEDMRDARRLGIATREAYAAVRARELEAAVEALRFTGERRSYGVRDQDAVRSAATIVDRLAVDLADAAVVVTHAYEGGHPDHDAAALAVRLAANRVGVPVVEFAGYHRDEGPVWGRFWADPHAPEQARALTAAEVVRVEAALATYRSQQAVFAHWRPRHERWRAAPAYDFAAPPPPGRALYDDWGWTLTSAGWREIARTNSLSYTPDSRQERAASAAAQPGATNSERGDRATKKQEHREMWEASPC